MSPGSSRSSASTTASRRRRWRSARAWTIPADEGSARAGKRPQLDELLVHDREPRSQVAHLRVESALLQRDPPRLHGRAGLVDDLDQALEALGETAAAGLSGERLQIALGEHVLHLTEESLGWPTLRRP